MSGAILNVEGQCRGASLQRLLLPTFLVLSRTTETVQACLVDKKKLLLAFMRTLVSADPPPCLSGRTGKPSLLMPLQVKL